MHVVSAALCAVLCTFIGYMAADRAEERHRAVKSLSDDIRLLSSQIDYTSEPLRVITGRLEGVSQNAVLWRSFAKSLAEGKPCSEAWADALCADETGALLTEEEVRELSAYFTSLGKSDRDTERKNSEHIHKLLERTDERISSELARKKKLCMSLGALFGLALAILII